ncbi:MAG: hypothetical protein HZA78_00675 [Candidatus Schekmanbacteria bacterium]|nr:hypothetical protein [Candidatus Schekmanbacteria bacterium]
MKPDKIVIIALGVIVSLGMIEQAAAKPFGKPGRFDSPGPWMEAKNYKEAREKKGKADHDNQDERQDKLDRIRKRVQTMFIWRVTEVLDLNEAQEAKVFPLIKKYEQESRQAIQERFKTKKELRKAIKNNETEDIKKLLSESERLNETIYKLHTQEVNELKGILDTTQLANYTLFREDFDREVQEMIFSVRHRRGRNNDHKRGPDFGESEDDEPEGE